VIMFIAYGFLAHSNRFKCSSNAFQKPQRQTISVYLFQHFFFLPQPNNEAIVTLLGMGRVHDNVGLMYNIGALKGDISILLKALKNK